MSDERSTHSAIDESDAADDPDSNGLEPNGGPQRVVSEESVDDILDSLESTSDSAAASEATTTVTESTGSVTTEFDEDDVPAADDVGTDTAGQSATSTTDSTATDSESAVDLEDDTATGANDETAPNADGDRTPGGDASIDAAASSLPDDTDDASLEDLADRIEDGTVTGADVRAAEAGEGRESTPEIDEVDLSMGDLEATQTGGAGDDDWTDDAGPLAGSVDRDGDAGTAAADADDDSDDSRGLFARLKGFFSR